MNIRKFATNKILYLFVLSLLPLLSACSSDEPGQDKDNSETEQQEPVSDWSVYYYEDSWQNEDWTYVYNTSPDCMSWRSEHESNLATHQKEEDREYWLWIISYPNTTQSEVVAQIEQFIKFTLWRVPNEADLSGIDVFSADLYGNDPDYRIYFSYSPENVGDLKDNWIITFTQYQYLKDGATAPSNCEYDNWVKSHQSYFTKSNVNSYDNSISTSNTWVMNVNSMSSEFVDTHILPFIRFSNISSDDFQDSFYVSVVHEGSGITQSYQYLSDSL